MKKVVITPSQMRVLEEAFTNTPETFEGENHHAPDLVDFQGRTYYWRNDDALPFFVLSDRTIEYGEKGERHDKHINDTYGDGFPARNFVDDIILQGRYWPSGNMFSFWDVDWDYFSAQQLISLMSKVCGDQGKNVEGAKLAYRDKVYGVAEGRFIELENTKERRTLDDAMYRSLDTMFKSELDYVKRTVYVMERVGQEMACRELNDLEAYAAACYRFSSDFFHNKNSQYDKEDFREYIDRKFKGRTSFDELYSYFTRVLRNKTVPSAQRNSYFHTMSNFKDDIMDCAYENGLADVDIRVLPDENGKPYSYNVKTMKASAAKKFYNTAIKRGFIVDRFMERPLNNWNGEPFDMITFRVRYPALLKEDTAIDNGYYGGINCTLNFDEDYYEEYLQDNGLQDLPAVKTEYVKDNCDWDVEYLDGETWHACDFKTLNYSEMEDDFGETLAVAILNDCMDGREHSFEFSEYRDDDVDIYNPQSLNKAAKRVMATMDSPCGQFRGWILTDGTVLDAGWDHNACFRISPEIKYREDFTRLGNVRFTNVSLEFGKYPTHEQLQQVRQFCEYHNQDVIYADFLGGKNGRADKKYVGLDFSELTADLYDYYSGRNIRSALQEATDIDELQLYHGTNADFDEFKEEFFLTGIGEMAYGWGVYLTNSKETAKEYGPGGQIMTVEVPDGKYLHSEKIRKDEAMRLARAFYKFYLAGKGGEIYKGSEQDFWDYECKYIGESPDGSYLYGTVSTFLGSDKEAGDWLRSMGYVGMIIPGHNTNTGEKFLNYLIFNPKDVKIIKKEAITESRKPLQETMHVLDDRLLGLAHYISERIWEREFDENIEFTLSREEMAQFYPYKNPTELSIEANYEDTSYPMRYFDGEKRILINLNKFFSHTENQVESWLVHELTHWVNDVEGGIPEAFGPNSAGVVNGIIRKLLYYLRPTEINARCSQFGYYLKGETQITALDKYEDITHLGRISFYLNSILGDEQAMRRLKDIKQVSYNVLCKRFSDYRTRIAKIYHYYLSR